MTQGNGMGVTDQVETQTIFPLKEKQGGCHTCKMTFRGGALVRFEGLGIEVTTVSKEGGLSLSYRTFGKPMVKNNQGKWIANLVKHTFVDGRFQAPEEAGELEIVLVDGKVPR